MLTSALLKRAYEPGYKHADILALAVDSSASTLDQGVSKAFYIFLEADVLGSSECVWAQSMALPGGG